MKIRPDDYRVRAGAKVRLKEWPTRIEPFFDTKERHAEALAAHVKELSDHQAVLYADNRHALLVIFQAMDAAGKDGAIKHVMSGVNPQGCQVHSFKHPGPEELAHDFLWRTTRCLPERGRIGIFNRSYYEEVLVVRVHPEILAAQSLPPGAADDKDLWRKRYRSINGLEKHLHGNGTTVVKIFLHLSKEEQRRRLLDRLENPAKNWKFSDADLAERARWDDYMAAYADCLSATSTKESPWYVVPADDKPTARLIISKILLDTLDGLDLRYPKPDKARTTELGKLREKLRKE